MMTHPDSLETFLARAQERKGADLKPVPKPERTPCLELTLANAFTSLGEGECQDWRSFWSGAIDQYESEGAAR